MLVRFFLLLKSAGVPVSITELLTLLEALKAGLGEITFSLHGHTAELHDGSGVVSSVRPSHSPNHSRS